MTCFWDAILSRISLDDINTNLTIDSTYFSINKKEFINLIKSKILHIDPIDICFCIKWNNEHLREKLIQENLLWIEQYDINKIEEGHYCSICDPFLMIICYIFKVNINHNYNGVPVIYTYCAERMICLKSDVYYNDNYNVLEEYSDQIANNIPKDNNSEQNSELLPTRSISNQLSTDSPPDFSIIKKLSTETYENFVERKSMSKIYNIPCDPRFSLRSTLAPRCVTQVEGEARTHRSRVSTEGRYALPALPRQCGSTTKRQYTN
jgi:hypothetical protein